VISQMAILAFLVAVPMTTAQDVRVFRPSADVLSVPGWSKNTTGFRVGWLGDAMLLDDTSYVFVDDSTKAGVPIRRDRASPAFGSPRMPPSADGRRGPRGSCDRGEPGSPGARRFRTASVRRQKTALRHREAQSVQVGMDHPCRRAGRAVRSLQNEMVDPRCRGGRA